MLATSRASCFIATSTYNVEYEKIRDEKDLRWKTSQFDLALKLKRTEYALNENEMMKKVKGRKAYCCASFKRCM